MDSLRVDSGVKRVEVNDNGEYIEIPISDTAFYERFAAIIKFFEEKQEDIKKRGKELSDRYKGGIEADAGEEDAAASTDMIADVVTLYSSLCRDVCAELDKLFGSGCCRKVFVGIETPGVELIGDFFEQITPLLQKYAKERNEKIEFKYSRGRKGARGQ